MAVPQNKTELISAIETSYQKLRAELESVPVASTKIKGLQGHAKGTSMSISDLVAYLIGWGELVIKWHRKKDNDEPVDFPETGYKWNQLGDLAQKFYEDYSHLDYPMLLDKLDTVVATIHQLIYKTTNKELYHSSWYDKWSQGKMIQLNTSSPFKNARLRIRRWKKENSAY